MMRISVQRKCKNNIKTNSTVIKEATISSRFNVNDIESVREVDK